MDKVWINFQVDSELDRKARIVAAQKRVSKSELLRLALAEYIEKQAKKEKLPLALEVV